jgi:ABC-2 type transport system ATP-binding protein
MSFGEIVAFARIDADVTQSQVHGPVDRDGAGKTTLSGLLLGLAAVDRGTPEVLATPVGRALAAPDGVTGLVDGPGPHPSPITRGSLAALAGLRASRRADGGDRRGPRAGLPASQ